MIYVYHCPVCDKRFRSPSKSEPCCTGPCESRDDHEMTVMILESVNGERINPIIGKIKSLGPLILDDMNP